ncbi:MAG: hypothetical protein NTW75_06285 [Planctomycetales bacterium]|nr:hypothetical protein [Planctomycetales bacterium]
MSLTLGVESAAGGMFLADLILFATVWMLVTAVRCFGEGDWVGRGREGMKLWSE